MLPATNRGVGTSIGFPDVCLTPTPAGPVPITYPNLGMTAQAAPFSPNVKISGVNAISMAAKITMTSGDEAGTAHATIKGPATFTAGSPLVKVNFVPGVTLTSPTMGNNGNNALGMVAVPSVSTVTFCRAEVPASLSPADVEALADAMQRADDVDARDEGEAIVLTLRAFTPATRTRVFQRLRERRDAAVVIDLRGNRGGDRDGMLRLAGDFLDGGTVLLREREADGDERVHRARGPRRYHGPLQVLIDGETASAAELFAAILQHHRRAAILGARSYGKATVHLVRPLPAGDGYPACAEARLPDGASLHDGVTPDVECAPAEALAVATTRGRCRRRRAALAPHRGGPAG